MENQLGSLKELVEKEETPKVEENVSTTESKEEVVESKPEEKETGDIIIDENAPKTTKALTYSELEAKLENGEELTEEERARALHPEETENLLKRLEMLHEDEALAKEIYEKKMLEEEVESISEKKEKKKSLYDDIIEVDDKTITVSEDGKQHVVDDYVPPIDLNRMKVKKVRDTSKKYASIKKARKLSAVTTQVSLPNSGLIMHMEGFSSTEIRNISLAQRSMDLFNFNKLKYEALFKKLQNTSVGSMSFEKFLKSVDFLEADILFYGAFCSTNIDKNTYPMDKCDHCGKSFEYEYSNADLLHIEDNEYEKVQKELYNLLKGSIEDPIKLFEESNVNMNVRIMLPETEDVVEIRMPSIHTFLFDVLKDLSEDDQNNATVELMPYIERIFVKEEPEKPADETDYIVLESFEDKLEELSTLGDKDDVTLNNALEREIFSKHHITFGIHSVVCPHCSHEQPKLPINRMEDMLFIMHQIHQEKKQ